MEHNNNEDNILENSQDMEFNSPEPIMEVGSFKATKIGEENAFEKDLALDEYSSDDAAKDSGFMSMQESFMQESAMKSYNPGDVVSGEILAIEKDGVMVDIGYMCDGFISLKETGLATEQDLSEEFKVGSRIDVQILKLESPEGFILLSKKGVDGIRNLEKIESAYSNKDILDAVVESSVKGGLIVRILGYKGFLPASHVVKDRGISLEEFVSKKLDVVVIDFDKRRSKIIVSNKNALMTLGKSETKEDVIEAIDAGSVVKGKVSSIKNFGVFVDLGGVEGLIHISELSWRRVEKPEDVLKVGQEVEVFVLGVDKLERKVSLGYKQLFPDPWVNVEEVYNVGDIVPGKVKRIVSFGAFVELGEGLEGLVHISEVSNENVKSVEEHLRIGEPVKVKILRIISEEKKIGLSIKAVENEADESINQDSEVKVTIGDMVNFDYTKEKSTSDENDKIVDEVLSGSSDGKSDLGIDIDDVLNV